MSIKKAPEAVVTKTGQVVLTNYCRKCMKNLPAKEFYECADNGFIDANGLMSVCKDCIQKIYDALFAENGSLEKTIHKMCTSLNIRYTNEAASATKAHINTILESGKHVNAIFSVYKMKLTATKKSMDKSGLEDATYEDVGTIFTSEAINTKEIPIPQDVIAFWGKDVSREDIEFLETQYANFKQTHKADTYAEKVLLRQVCFTMLDIKKARAQQDDTAELVKELQTLMKNLAISPNAVNSANVGKAMDTFGLWIQDIERGEPAQWLKTDPRGDIYRDVGNVEEYFQKYIVRPLKNAIQGSKDFNIDDSEKEDDELIENAEKMDIKLIDDGELEE
jgi:hypothetical protein